MHATVADRLRRTSASATPRAREALVTILERASTPLSTAEIVEARTGPQSSVYRNLSVLEHAGVVRRVVTEGEFARFELAEELTEHHHHLICSNCGTVEDVTIPPGSRDHDGSNRRPARAAERVREGAAPSRSDRHVPRVRVTATTLRA